jgi:hypothetical protein
MWAYFRGASVERLRKIRTCRSQAWVLTRYFPNTDVYLGVMWVLVSAIDRSLLGFNFVHDVWGLDGYEHEDIISWIMTLRSSVYSVTFAGEYGTSVSRYKIFLYPIPGGTRFLRIVGTCMPDYVVSRSGWPLPSFIRVKALSHSREKRLFASSFPSICLSACISAAPTGRISVKFDIGEFFENLSRKPDLGKIEQKCRAIYMTA